MRKLILPIAAFAMASFVACSDDSSPNAPAAGPKQDTLPTSVEKFFDLVVYLIIRGLSGLSVSYAPCHLRLASSLDLGVITCITIFIIIPHQILLYPE